MQTELTILGGLPVTIDFDVCKRGGKDEIIWTVEYINGEVCSRSHEWIYTRVYCKPGEEDRIINACREAFDKSMAKEKS